MAALRDFNAETRVGGEAATERFVRLLKLLGSRTDLPFDQLSDADIKSSFSWMKTQS